MFDKDKLITCSELTRRATAQAIHNPVFTEVIVITQAVAVPGTALTEVKHDPSVVILNVSI